MDTSGLDDFDDLFGELPARDTWTRRIIHANHRPIGQPLGRE
jgi:hypothetical protein